MDNIIVAGKPLQDLKVTELKDELGKRSLSKTGNKMQLCARLGEYLLANPEGMEEPQRAAEEPARKGSPPKSAAVPAVGDSIIAQYLADRESMLAESLDHKRKVQGADFKPEPEDALPKTEPETNKTSVLKSPPRTEPSTIRSLVDVTVPAAAEEEEEMVQPDSSDSSSRRKGRKPEFRRSTRSSDKGGEEEEHLPDSPSKKDTSAPAPVILTAPTKATSPVAMRNAKVSSPRKEELGSQARTTVEKINAVATNSGSDSTVAVDENEKIESNNKMVSRVKVGDEKAVAVEASVVAPTGPLGGDGKSIDVTPLAETGKSGGAKPTEPDRSEKEPKAAGRESPVEKKVTRSTRSADVKSPSPVKEGPVVKSAATVAEPSVTAPTSVIPIVAPELTGKAAIKTPVTESTTVNLSGEKKTEEVLALPRKLTESLSVEEEKLDYGEIEPEDDVVMREETAVPRPESPRGQKRRQSINTNSDKVVTTVTPGNDKRDDIMKARSEKFGTPLVDAARDIKEPPRKMARSGYTGSASKDDSSQPVTPTTSSHGKSTSPPPSRNPVSRMIHIRNLVRPYTANQLKELLKKTGNILEDENHFWTDQIKSQCIVTYTTEAEAEASRKALYNLIWPSSNPQKLVVEFLREEDFKERTTAPSTPVPVSPVVEGRRVPGTTSSVRPHIDRPAVEKLKITVASNKETGEAHRDVAIARLEEKRLERQAEREKELTKDPVDTGRQLTRTDSTADKALEREWDRGKSQTIPKDTTPSKPIGTSLEVLFQKTEARPPVYWKPLTDDEIKMREDELKTASAQNDRRKVTLERREDNSDRPRRDSSRERRISDRRDSPQRRSRSRGRDERGFRTGNGSSGRPSFGSGNRRNNSPYRRRRTPSPKFRSGGGRRSRSGSRGRRF